MSQNIRDQEEFMRVSLDNFLSSGYYDKAVEQIKRLKLTIDEFGCDNHKLDDIISKFSNIQSASLNPRYSSLKKESLIFNKIFRRIRHELESIDSTIKPGCHLQAFLLAIEIKLVEYTEKINKELQNNSGKKDTYPLSYEIERIIDLTGTILNYFAYKKFSSVTVIHDISKDDIANADMYIGLASIWLDVKEMSEIWANGKLSITESDGTYVFNSRNSNVISAAIAKQMYGEISTAKQFKFDFMEVHNFKQYSLTDILPPLSFNSYKEECSYEFLTEVLFYGDDVIGKKGITLMQLLRAYSVIINESNDYKIKTYYGEKLNCYETCIIKDKEYWVDQFMKNGIPKKYASEIFELLVFNNSRDLLDCPLIKIGNLYALLPTLSKSTNAGKALVSNLASKSINISRKGRMFENYLKNIISEKGINFISAKRKNDNVEYEYDLVFAINNDVFCVEVKNLSPIRDYRDYVKSIEEMKNACEQINRWSTQLFKYERVDELLEIEHINSVNRIVVTSVPVGEYINIDGVYVTDEVYFSGYFLRNAPKVNYFNYKDNKIVFISLYKEYYEGEFSGEQLLGLIQNIPLQKSILKNRVKNTEVKYEFLNMIYKTSAVVVDSITLSPDSFFDDLMKYS